MLKTLEPIHKSYELLSEFKEPSRAALNSISVRTLVDNFGIIKAVRAITKTLEQAIAENLKERLSIGATEGKLFRCTYSAFERTFFNEEACFRELKKFFKKKELQVSDTELAELISKFYVKTEIEMLRCTTRRGE